MSDAKIHTGNLIITAKNAERFADLTEVTGWLTVREGATLNANALTEVIGWLYVYEGATLNAPALKKTGGLIVREGATLNAPALKRE